MQMSMNNIAISLKIATMTVAVRIINLAIAMISIMKTALTEKSHQAQLQTLQHMMAQPLVAIIMQ